MTTSPSQEHSPVVGVVTVSYGSGRVLGDFLRSIPAATSHRIVTVVVDNKGQDRQVAQLSRDANATHLPLEHNVGYGQAMNLGVACMPAEVTWILLSNPDVILERSSIDSLITTGESDSAIGAVGPAILTDNDIYPSARAVPQLFSGIGHALFGSFWRRNPWTLAYYGDFGKPIRRDAGWLSGACVLVRRTAFEQLEGFDPGYFMYFEDVDLGFRMGKAGYRNLYDPTAIVRHSGAHSTSSESPKMIRAHHESAMRFITRRYPRWWNWPVRAALALGLSARSTIMVRRSNSNHTTSPGS